VVVVDLAVLVKTEMIEEAIGEIEVIEEEEVDLEIEIETAEEALEEDNIVMAIGTVQNATTKTLHGEMNVIAAKHQNLMMAVQVEEIAVEAQEEIVSKMTEEMIGVVAETFREEVCVEEIVQLVDSIDSVHIKLPITILCLNF
jgi:uncharacterized protein (DUF2344 family)